MSLPTLAEALRSATAQLAMHDTARLDAELLLAHVLGSSRSHLIAWPERKLAEPQAQRFTALVARRAAGEPIAHILGRREFWSLDLDVTPDTLIPRPETELLVELALEIIPSGATWNVADLGTGTGAVALALAKERPTCRIHASDRSAAALAIAEGNAMRLGLRNLDFRLGSWHQPFAGMRFDAILSNPPYVRESDPHLSRGDVRFDPRSALVAGPTGLEDLSEIVGGAMERLQPGGWLLVEHGYDQADAVTEQFERAGFEAVVTASDLGGQPRVTRGRRPSSAP